jgi:sporadic carbohydrate cluster 2OG-Fe(II) oxygenase
MKNFKIYNQFYKNGYIIKNIEDLSSFKRIKDETTKIILKFLNIKKKPNFFLENLHQYVEYQKINSLRMRVYKIMNQKSWFQNAYFNLAKKTIEDLVGNELAGQNSINFSFQFPYDKNSQLSLHADSLSGESAFQVVLWVPLMSVYKSNSMYVSSKEDSIKNVHDIKNFSKHGMFKIYKNLKNKVNFLKIKKNQFLIFSPNLLHGNIVNKTKITRISMNARYKNLFSPYNKDQNSFGKKLGYFYKPIGLKPVTKFALEFKIPDEF